MTVFSPFPNLPDVDAEDFRAAARLGPDVGDGEKLERCLQDALDTIDHGSNLAALPLDLEDERRRETDARLFRLGVYDIAKAALIDDGILQRPEEAEGEPERLRVSGWNRLGRLNDFQKTKSRFALI